MPTTTNRTKWPILGGAIAVQPGWFQGHATAFFYMNLGFGTDGPDNGPQNMSFPMVPVFQIVGPSKNPYPGTFCLPQVPLPANTTVNPGDNATIQVVETAIHGAALYSVGCPSITLNLCSACSRLHAARAGNVIRETQHKRQVSVTKTNTFSSASTSPSLYPKMSQK